MGKLMKEFIETIVKQLVDNPDKVIVEETNSDDNTLDLQLKIDQSDIGKVIGKKGQNITALRTLLSAASKGKYRTKLDIIDEIDRT
jgi:predicted RNA-binding protein YlqC (UPF0109 family)